MPIEVGEATKEALVQSFILGNKTADGNLEFTANQARLQFMLSSNLANAHAAGELGTSHQAREILQARAASDQPNTK